jgi:hypothetical protein
MLVGVFGLLSLALPSGAEFGKSSRDLWLVTPLMLDRQLMDSATEVLLLPEVPRRETLHMEQNNLRISNWEYATLRVFAVDPLPAVPYVWY